MNQLQPTELIIEALDQFVPEYNALSAGADDYPTKLEIKEWVKRLHRMPAHSRNLRLPDPAARSSSSRESEYTCNCQVPQHP